MTGKVIMMYEAKTEADVHVWNSIFTKLQTVVYVNIFFTFITEELVQKKVYPVYRMRCDKLIVKRLYSF